MGIDAMSLGAVVVLWIVGALGQRDAGQGGGGGVTLLQQRSKSDSQTLSPVKSGPVQSGYSNGRGRGRFVEGRSKEKKRCGGVGCLGIISESKARLVSSRCLSRVAGAG